MNIESKKLLKSQQPRDAAIELYRCLLAFGIVLIHSNQKPFFVIEHTYMLEWCVNGFIFITGYYGIRYRFNKLLFLFVTAYISAGVSYLLFTPLSGDQITAISCIKYAAYNGGDYWFVGSYAVLLLLSPAINEILEKHCDIKQWKWWLPVMILGLWSWAIDWRFHRVFEWILPQYDLGFGRTLGMGAFSPITLILCYIGARFCHKYQDSKIFKNKLLLLAIMVVLIPFVSLGFGLSRYSSPFAFTIAACGFFLFKGIKLPNYIGKFFIFLAPSMLGVYLIHCTDIGLSFMSKCELYLIETHHYPRLISCFITAGAIFFLTLCCDMVRRLLFKFVTICIAKFQQLRNQAF